MMLVIHITIALTSLGYTTYTWLRPSQSKLHLSYALAALTVMSGFYLAWNNLDHMTQACATGLIYIGAVSFGIMSARRKLMNPPQ